MYDIVLLPVDLNNDASWTKALPAAKGLLNEGGVLHILAIVPDLGAAIVSSFLPDGFEAEAIRKTETHLNEFASANAADVMTSIHVGHGHVAETILDVAAANGAGAIVMASHPPDDLRNFLVGSNAEKVVRHAETPVLVVR